MNRPISAAELKKVVARQASSEGTSGSRSVQKSAISAGSWPCSVRPSRLSSLLQSFQELPLGQTSRIKPDELEGLADQASQLSVALGRLQAVVGEEDKDVSEKEVAVAASEMDLVLQKCQSRLDDWQSNLDAVSEEFQHVKAEILDWLRIAAITVTVACVWVAVSQISLFAHACKWFRSVSR